MRKIPLTQGKFALVDDEDYKWLNQWKWHAQKNRNGDWHGARNDYSSGKRKRIIISRLIIGASKGQIVHHGNHNTLDNRKFNLQNCTRSENGSHRKKQQRKSTSIFKGVSWCGRLNKWLSQLRINGELKHFGCFDDEVEAAKRYDKGAIKYFGAFALTNETMELY